LDLDELTRADAHEGLLFTRSRDLLMRGQNLIERSLIEAPLVSTYVKRLVEKTMGEVLKVGQAASMWPLHLGIACCAIEMAAMGASRFDAERLGVLFWSSPRQCDVLFINGTVSRKFAPRLRMLYDQMPEPKWAMAVGNCAISGGPFFEGYNTVLGADQILPVDVYVPGCPPKPEAMLFGLIKLQEKILNQRPDYLGTGIRQEMAHEAGAR
jgi:NADH-quinone oxidoreductase subunit B